MTALSPRYVLVHSRDAMINIAEPSPFAHCFGPFDDLNALLAFEDEQSEDDCYRFAIPLVGPEPLDLSIIAIGRAIGARPATIGLPERRPERERDANAQALIDKALRKARKRAKRERKRQKGEG